MAFDTAMASRLVKVTRGFGQRDKEVEPDLVVPLTSKVEEVLRYMEKSAALHFLAKFFPHFSDDRGRCLLACFHPTAGQRPIVVARGPVNKHVAIVKDDRSGTNLEAVAVKMDRDHGSEVSWGRRLGASEARGRRPLEGRVRRRLQH